MYCSLNSSGFAPLTVVAIACILNACGVPQAHSEPAITFAKVPLTKDGVVPGQLAYAEGHVAGAKAGERVVLYAKNDLWWVQPFAVKPFTDIKSDATWRNLTHAGTEYAALLVDSSFVPPLTTTVLPGKGGSVLAVAKTAGIASAPALKTIRFSGYDWEIRGEVNDRGGKPNLYDPANAWTDKGGLLHLRLDKRGDQWACVDMRLMRSLGQGSYSLTVRDLSRLDPAAVMTFYTWDDGAPADQHQRQIDIEISRWGDAQRKNGQYVVQPYYEPANVERFEAPAGPLILSFQWEPGKIVFRTTRGRAADLRTAAVAEHRFTSGVPSPGGESVHLNLYAFGNTRVPLRHGAEVIVEKFEYLP